MPGSFKGVVLFSVRELHEAYKLGTLARVLRQKLECYFKVPEEIDKGQIDQIVHGATARMSVCNLPPGSDDPDAPALIYRVHVGTTPEEVGRLEFNRPDTMLHEFRRVRL